MLNKFETTLKLLKQEQNYRSLPQKSSEPLLDLCSNDYLGLNDNKQLYRKFLHEFEQKEYKFSSTSSRLLSGNSIEHTFLEQQIAESYQREAALIFNSGYHANAGIIPALTSKRDLIVADKLVHASIIDGTKLSTATTIRYKHLDYDHLELILQKNRNKFDNVFIISESIFSMDGDIADIEKLVELKQIYNCLLYIDEAHAVGVRGNRGLGCADEQNLIPEIDFIVGTFGKALASVGAYVVCDNLFREFLINHARTLIFTTALPPVNLAWTKFIFAQLPELNHKRKALKTLGIQFAELLNIEFESHIVPYIIGSNGDAIAKSQMLKANGFNVLPIRYPTVPKETARLRFSLNAKMNINQLIPIKKLLENHE